MPGTSFFTRVNGLKQDQHIHQPILDRDFSKTPAFKFAVKRAVALGLTEAQAKAVMKPKPDSEDTS
jgi:hypothetical protein